MPHYFNETEIQIFIVPMKCVEMTKKKNFTFKFDWKWIQNYYEINFIFSLKLIFLFSIFWIWFWFPNKYFQMIDRKLDWCSLHTYKHTYNSHSLLQIYCCDNCIKRNAIYLVYLHFEHNIFFQRLSKYIMRIHKNKTPLQISHSDSFSVLLSLTFELFSSIFCFSFTIWF